MEDKFDKILSSKIKNLSENREIPYNPEHWDLLLAKKNKKKRGAFTYWKYAAIFLLALLAGGLGNYFFNNEISVDKDNSKIILDEINDSLRIDSLLINPNIEISSINSDSLLKGNSNVLKSEIVFGVEKTNSKEESSIAKTAKIPENVPENNNYLATQSDDQLIETSIDSLQKTSAEDKIFGEINSDLITQSSNQIKDSLNVNSKIAFNDDEVKKDSLNNKLDFLVFVEDDEFVQETNSRAIKLGLNLSPVIDYSQENVSSNVGFAGGVIVEFPILKKFNINTGIYYSNQKLDLNSNQPSAYLTDGVGAKESTKIVDEEAIIEGIGIPLNIKYNFEIKDKNFFVSTGFSSSSYFKEDIESQQIVNARTASVSKDFSGKNIVKYELIQLSETIVISEDQNTFNFANALNFSMGIELPVNNQKQSIIIEPYFKYYLQPVTPKKIDYNSIGFHFRYNFNFTKNK